MNCRPPITLDAAATVTGVTKWVAGSKLKSEELKLKVAVKSAVPELLICNGRKNGGGAPKNGVGTPTATGPISTEDGVALKAGVPCRAIARPDAPNRETATTTILKIVFNRMLLTFHENYVYRRNYKRVSSN